MPTLDLLPQSSLLKLILGILSACDSSRTSHRRWCEQFFARFGQVTVAHALFTRCCCYSRAQVQAGNEEAPALDSPEVTCIVASFDAWLFVDSDVLWAVLISEISRKIDGVLSSYDIRLHKSNGAVYWGDSQMFLLCRPQQTPLASEGGFHPHHWLITPGSSSTKVLTDTCCCFAVD